MRESLDQSFSSDVAKWQQRGKSKDRWFRGSQLTEAQAGAKHNLLSDYEVAFLPASAASRRRCVVSVIVTVLLLLVVSTGLMSCSLLPSPNPGRSEKGDASPYSGLMSCSLVPSPNPTCVTTLQDNGVGSLRWAVANAPSGRTITFDSGLKGTILLTSTDLRISKNVTIRGPGVGILAISSGRSRHIVHVLQRVTTAISDLTFKDSDSAGTDFILNEGVLTLSNSTVSNNNGGISNKGGTLTLSNSTVSNGGRGILNEGTLILSNSTISGNSTSGGIYNDKGSMLTLSNSTISGNMKGTDNSGGGGIYNAGMLTISNSSISGNSVNTIHYSSSYGGGIYNDKGGTLTLSNSTISGNSVSASGGAYGGGIDNEGTLTLSNSTVSGNSASSGGGISNSGILTLSNSTISGNSASGVDSTGCFRGSCGTYGVVGGGGIFIQSFISGGAGGSSSIVQAELTFSTISGNTASVGGDIVVQDITSNSRAEIKAIKQLSQVKISNSIVAAEPAHRGPDVSGTLTSYGYNLFQDTSGATFDPATSTQHGTDKTLSVNDVSKVFADPVGLRDNGGPTRTYALAPGSPALDQIPLDACHVRGIITDQRGVKRPDDNEDVCDIGAYESSL